MEAAKCDRCGDFYIFESKAQSLFDDIKDLLGYEKVISVDCLVNTNKSSKKLDLCPKCRHSLEKWLDRGEADNGSDQ